MESSSIKALALLVPLIWWMYKILICAEISYCIPIAMFLYLVKLLEDERKKYEDLLIRVQTEQKNIKNETSQTEEIITTDKLVQTNPRMHMNNKQIQCNLENKPKAGGSSHTQEISFKNKTTQTYLEKNNLDNETKYNWPKHCKTGADSEIVEISTEDKDMPLNTIAGTEKKQNQNTQDYQEKNISSQTPKSTAIDKSIPTTVETNTSYTCLLYYPIGHDGLPCRKLKEKIKFKPTIRTIQEIEKDTLFNNASNESKISGIPEGDPSLRVIHFAGKEIRYRVKLSPPPKLSSIFEVQEINSNTSKEKTLNQEMSKQTPMPAASKNGQHIDDSNPQYSNSISKEFKKNEMRQKGETLPYFRKKFRKYKNWFMKK